jgi:Tol biopolymer transport system component
MIRLTFLLLFANVLVAYGQTDPAKEKQFITNARQLIYEGKRSGEGYFSPDGKNLIFQAERDTSNPFYQIYILSLETGDINRVSPGYGKTTCSFFMPNSDRVIFSSSHLDPKAREKQKAELDFRASGQKRRYSWDYEPEMDIFSANRDGSGIKRLTTTLGYDAEGGVSPDGKKIVFCSNRDAFSRTLSADEKKRLELEPSWFGDIYIMNIDGTGQTRLTTTSGYDGGPFFSPDGSRIIWRRFADDGVTADIYTMKTDGSDVKKITDFHAMSWAPYFHPSGQYIIFASNKLGFDNFELYIVDIEGKKEPVQVTYTMGFDGLPVPSPDGSKISWSSTRTKEGASHIFMANWNHEAALQALSQAPVKGSQPVTNNGDKGDSESFRQIVSFLASDSLEGRMTGSKGLQKAVDFITKTFTKAGLTPLGSNPSFLSQFKYTAGIEPNAKACKLSTTGAKKATYTFGTDFNPCTFSMNGKADGEVVFAGYGIKTPKGSETDYNSYTGTEVKDKIVLVLEGLPEGMEDKQRKSLVRYSGERYKAMIARELGAKAIIFIKLEGSSAAHGHENTSGNAGIIALYVNRATGEALISPKAKLDKVLEDLKSDNPHAERQFVVKDLKLNVEVKLDKIEKNDNNIFGVLTASKPTDPYILVGGHMDHLGYGETSSLADSDKERSQIHNGADDNASGTATVIKLAQYFAELKKGKPELLTKNIIFALWSGEELGLVGSEYFTSHPVIPLKNIQSYLNFDMVGRLKDNKLIMQGLGSSAEWSKLVEKKNVKAGFDLVLQDDPYVPTDAMSLYQAGVPVLCFFTGIHDDYHRPSDDADKIDYPGMVRIEQFAADILADLLKKDSMPYAKVAMSASQTSASRGFTVYLGTIPDYVAEVEGVKLSGVREGGPASRAGLKKDDIIISLAGKEIKNVYDYTYVLGDLKAGEKVYIVIMRDGKKVTLEVTPEAK